jgi:hypothetical protein
MTRGRLHILPVPWMVSPSVPDFHVRIVENADTIVALNVLALAPSATVTPGLLDRGVDVRFEHGQWVRTCPAASDTDPIPEGLFDRGELGHKAPIQDTVEWTRVFRERWRADSSCPDPSFYEVMDSSWIREQNAARFGCRHLVLVGHDLWIEVLCTNMSWRWVARASVGIETW